MNSRVLRCTDVDFTLQIDGLDETGSQRHGICTAARHFHSASHHQPRPSFGPQSVVWRWLRRWRLPVQLVRSVHRDYCHTSDCTKPDLSGYRRRLVDTCEVVSAEQTELQAASVRDPVETQGQDTEAALYVSRGGLSQLARPHILHRTLRGYLNPHRKEI